MTALHIFTADAFDEFKAAYNAEVLHPLDRLPGGYAAYETGLWMKHRIAGWVAPKTIVELGVRCGYSAWAMLRAAPSAKYIGFDSFLPGHADVKNVPNVQELFKAHAEKILAGYDADIRVGNTQDPGFSAPPAELYHVDATHHFDCTRLDILNCVEAGGVGSIIVVHDFMAPAVREAALDAAGRVPQLSVYEIPEPANGDGVLFTGVVPSWLAEVDAQMLA